MKNLAFLRLFGRKLNTFDLKAIKLVGNSADDVTVPNMAKVV